MKPTLLLQISLCFFIYTTSFSQTPSNDLPANAIALTVGSGSCTNITAGTLVDATDSQEGGTPSCGGGLTSDVWYEVAVPASGNLSIEIFNVGNNFFDSVLTVYSGTLGNLTELDCNNNGGFDALSKIALADQTAGETLYIRVWGSFADRAAFEICAWDQMPLSLEKVSESASLQVYPNPVTDILHIDSAMRAHQVAVYQLSGVKVLAATVSENKQKLDVSSLSAGVYIMRISHDKGSQYVRFIKE